MKVKNKITNGPIQIDTRDETLLLITINKANVNKITIKSHRITTILTTFS